MTGAKVIQIGSLTPKQLASLCRRNPDVDRVEATGTSYIVFPKDKDRRPVFFSAIKFGSSGKCENTLSDLRKSGIDVERTPPTSRPVPAAPTTPTATTQETPTVSAPATRPTPHAPLMDRREGAELRDMVRAAVEGSDSVVSMMAEAERRIATAEQTIAALTKRVDAQDRTIARLRESGGDPIAKPPSKAAVMREVVLAYFVSMPGTKMNPQFIELNAPNMPEDRSPTAVANACKELATAGKIQGGGTRDRANREKGIYWYEAPAEES